VKNSQVPHPIAPAGREVFPLFDGLRAIAALSIVVHHASTAPPTPLAPYILRLNVGVPIFFVISAFLLYRPFAAAHLRGRPAPSLGGYAWRRVLRIMPAYWVALTIAAVLLSMRSVFGPDGVFYYGLLHVYKPRTVLGGLGVSWSLCIELTLYLMLPAWAVFQARTGRGLSPERRLRREVIGLTLLYVLGLAFKRWFFWDSTPRLVHGLMIIGPSSLPNYVGTFALGMGLAVASVWYADHRPSRLIRSVSLHPGACWAVAGVTFAIVATQLGLPPSNWKPTTPSRHLAYTEMYNVIAVALVMPAVFGIATRGAVRRVLGSTVLLWIGSVSYGVYLWHQVVYSMLARHGITADVAGALRVSTFVAALALCLPITMIMAWLSWRLVERPALSLRTLRPPAALAPERPVSATVRSATAVVLGAVGLVGTGYTIVDAALVGLGLGVAASLIPAVRLALGRLPVQGPGAVATVCAIGAAIVTVPLLLPPHPPRPAAAVSHLPPRAYVAASFDGRSVDLYVNGRVVARRAQAGKVDRGAGVTELGSFLGRHRWNGGIDDVALYRRALDPATVSEHFRLGLGEGARYDATVRGTPGIAGFWRLADIGALARDDVGRADGRYSPRGIGRGQMSLVSGAGDRSVTLDGVAGGLQIPAAPRPRKAFTVEAWVTTGTSVTDRTIMARPGAWFVTTDLLGHWSAGIWNRGRIVSVASHNTAKPLAPSSGRPPVAAAQDRLPGLVAISLAALAALWLVTVVPTLQGRPGTGRDPAGGERTAPRFDDALEPVGAPVGEPFPHQVRSPA
jgi:peptidoglycan/LPS O-acetylase OafA/YrhL